MHAAVRAAFYTFVITCSCLVSEARAGQLFPPANEAACGTGTVLAWNAAEGAVDCVPALSGITVQCASNQALVSFQGDFSDPANNHQVCLTIPTCTSNQFLTFSGNQFSFSGLDIPNCPSNAALNYSNGAFVCKSLALPVCTTGQYLTSNDGATFVCSSLDTCQPNWTTTSIGNCSATCGGGTENIVQSDGCGHTQVTQQVCNTQTCQCTASTASWGTSCSAPVAALEYGSSITVTNTATGSTGSVTITCNSGTLVQSSPSCTHTQATYVYFTTTGSGAWTVPTGVASITVEAIGGGGHGGYSDYHATGGGGGGAYAKSVFTVTPGSIVYYNVGSAQASSWATISANAAPTNNSQGVLAAAGLRGGDLVGGAGGSTASSIYNTLAYAGGAGSNYGGGGGAAGPNGAGNTPTSYAGGSGDAGLGGAAGNAGGCGANGIAGGNGTEYGSRGAGGGGGDADFRLLLGHILGWQWRTNMAAGPAVWVATVPVNLATMVLVLKVSSLSHTINSLWQWCWWLKRGGREALFPVPRKQFVQLLHGMIRQVGEHVS